MTTGIFRGIEAMASAERRLELVAENLANSSSAAYKRRTSFSESMAQGVDGKRRDLVTRTGVDFSQGPLKSTLQPTDLALHGSGFFAVESDSGEVYTRDGRFQVDGEGNLLTGDGYPVAWERTTTRFDPNGPRIYVDGDGGVRQGSLEVGRLRIVDFADPQKLSLDSKGYWNAPASLQEIAHDSVVRQGFLEQSNAQPMLELIELIELQRSYESASNAVRSIDQSYKRLHQHR